MTERENQPQTADPLPWRVLLVYGISLLGPALAWALHLNVSYFLVQPVCRMGGELALHATSVVSLALVLGAVVASVRLLRRNPAPFQENVQGCDGWKAFIGLFGIATGVIFSVAIIAAWAPMFVIGPCAG